VTLYVLIIQNPNQKIRIKNFKDEIYFSSFSYCDSDKNYIKKGAISRLNSSVEAEVILDGIHNPHSITSYNDKMFVCSSGSAKVFSFNLDEKILNLEFKGPDAFVRGLLPFEKNLIIGTSYSVGRTDSKFTNIIASLLFFNKKTEKVEKLVIPEFCNNVYSITK